MNPTPAQDTTAPAVPHYHAVNADGFYIDPEQIFVPLPAGNICHFLIVHTADGFVGGYKFFIRSPRNILENLPKQSPGQSPKSTRQEAVLELVGHAAAFFTGHGTLLERLQIWVDEFRGIPHAESSPTRKAVVDHPSLPAVEMAAEPVAAEVRRSRFDSIAVADIELNPQNPRKSRTEASLAELTEAIRAQGELLQPIAVRDMGEQYAATSTGKRFRLIFGEGRWLAHQRLNWEKIDAKIYTGLTAADALAKALVENLSREDMNAMDEAEGFAELSHLGWTPEQMAKQTGKSEVTIRRALGLAKLPDEVQALVRTGELSARQARELLGWVSAPHNAGDFIKRPDVCVVIAKIAAKSAFDISSDRLSLGVPVEAVPALKSAKLIVEIPGSYRGDVEIGETYFRLGDSIYTFDAAVWKIKKKDIDAEEKRIIAEAKDRAASKFANGVSLPVQDLAKAGVECAQLPAADERYAEWLPDGAIATGIGKDKGEVALVVNPEALALLKGSEAIDLARDRAVKLPGLQLQATAALKKLRKIGAREMAFVVECFGNLMFGVTYLNGDAFKAQDVKPPKDLTRESLAKMDPVELVRVFLQSALIESKNESAEMENLRWILDTPKLGLIEEDEKARSKLLARLSDELWPKAAAVTPPTLPTKKANNSRKK